MPDTTGTLVAEATPPGRGAVRVVRLSGAQALPILKRLFLPTGPDAPWDSPRRLCLGRFLDAAGAPLDEGLAVFFAAPASFTGEDAVEFQGHGSPAVIRGLTEACTALGARPALPGEFSYRAFLNGKVTLPEAEAVNALTASETALQALAAAAGPFEARARELRERLLDLVAAWEARVDFPEEAAVSGGPAPAESLREVRESLAALQAAAKASRSLREGWRVALCGVPNAGKSSLFNALLSRERALVTPHPGTTRDVLEETLDLGGLPIVLLDTAGLRPSLDPVESMGISRGREATEQADGVLLLWDRSAPWGESEAGVAAAAGKRLIAVVETKSDLPGRASGAPDLPVVPVSAVTGQGLDILSGKLSAWAASSLPAGGPLLLSAHQTAGVARAAAACAAAAVALQAGGTEEVALVGLRESLSALDDLLGGGDPEALYDRIFSTFCIGK